jgi:hypothetical protein
MRETAKEMGNPVNLKGKHRRPEAGRESGFINLDFQQSVSPSMVKPCEAAHALVKGSSERKSGKSGKKVSGALVSALEVALNYLAREKLSQAD